MKQSEHLGRLGQVVATAIYVQAVRVHASAGRCFFETTPDSKWAARITRQLVNGPAGDRLTALIHGPDGALLGAYDAIVGPGLLPRSIGGPHGGMTFWFDGLWCRRPEVPAVVQVLTEKPSSPPVQTFIVETATHQYEVL